MGYGNPLSSATIYFCVIRVIQVYFHFEVKNDLPIKICSNSTSINMKRFQHKLDNKFLQGISICFTNKVILIHWMLMNLIENLGIYGYFLWPQKMLNLIKNWCTNSAIRCTQRKQNQILRSTSKQNVHSITFYDLLFLLMSFL